MDGATEVAQVRWGEPPDGTDTASISLRELPNGDIQIIQQAMGPETQASHGAYDYEQCLTIKAADHATLTTMLLSLAFDGPGSCDWESLTGHCRQWSIPYQEAGKAIS